MAKDCLKVKKVLIKSLAVLLLVSGLSSAIGAVASEESAAVSRHSPVAAQLQDRTKSKEASRTIKITFGFNHAGRGACRMVPR